MEERTPSREHLINVLVRVTDWQERNLDMLTRTKFVAFKQRNPRNFCEQGSEGPIENATKNEQVKPGQYILILVVPTEYLIWYMELETVDGTDIW